MFSFLFIGKMVLNGTRKRLPTVVSKPAFFALFGNDCANRAVSTLPQS